MTLPSPKKPRITAHFDRCLTPPQRRKAEKQLPSAVLFMKLCFGPNLFWCLFFRPCPCLYCQAHSINLLFEDCAKLFCNNTPHPKSLMVLGTNITRNDIVNSLCPLLTMHMQYFCFLSGREIYKLHTLSPPPNDPHFLDHFLDPPKD